MAEDFFDRIEEAHVQHLVGLVENNGVDIAAVDDATVYKIDQSPRSRHYHLNTGTKRPDLALYARAAVDGQHSDVGDIFREVSEVAGNLETEFARGSEYERLRHMFRRVDPLKHRKPEGGRLACSGLGQRDNIAAVVAQKMRNHSLLHRHRGFKAKFFYGTAKRLSDAQLLKSFHCQLFVWGLQI